MKTLLLSFCIVLALAASEAGAGDLPTITVEHLYYLRSRGERINALRPDEMIDYCLAQKLGGHTFEDFYGQLFQMRVELTKLMRIEGLQDSDDKVLKLRRTYDEYLKLLREEAQKVQHGIAREGLVADDTLQVIARVQNQNQNQQR
jgi:hypothetical protein